jgi:hypothetical protein
MIDTHLTKHLTSTLQALADKWWSFLHIMGIGANTMDQSFLKQAFSITVSCISLKEV